jgi:hypothetical protein
MMQPSAMHDLLLISREEDAFIMASNPTRQRVRILIREYLRLVGRTSSYVVLLLLLLANIGRVAKYLQELVDSY